MNYPPIPFCCYCGKVIQHPLQDTTEHLVPKSRGGSNLPHNKRRCCHLCNRWRADKELGFAPLTKQVSQITPVIGVKLGKMQLDYGYNLAGREHQIGVNRILGK